MTSISFVALMFVWYARYVDCIPYCISVKLPHSVLGQGREGQEEKQSELSMLFIVHVCRIHCCWSVCSFSKFGTNI